MNSRKRKPGRIALFWLSIGLFLLFLHTPSFSYSDWLNFDPGGGGSSSAVVCHPTDSSIVWVSTDLNGYHRSTDGGRRFEYGTAKVELETNGTGHVRNSLYQLALDPSDPNVVYFAIHSMRINDNRVFKQGVWKSTDKGVTWSYLDTEYSDLLPAASMVVDYGGNLYCVQNGQTKNFYVSTDKGKTFVKKASLPFVTAPSPSGHVALGVSRKNWVYAASPYIYVKKDGKWVKSYQKGLYYSTDKGGSWNPVAALVDKRIASFACSPQDDNVVVAMTFTGEIWRTENGVTFLQTGKVSNKPGSFHGHHGLGGININGKGIVIAWGWDGSRAISHDKGRNFKPLKFVVNRGDLEYNLFTRLPQCTMLSASPVSDHWYATTGMFTYQSTNNGESWIIRCKGIQIHCIKTWPIVDITNPNRVHAAGADAGHFYTTNLGASWENSAEAPFAHASGLAQDPNNPKVFYRIYGWKENWSSRRICKSTDGGVKWEQIGSLPDSTKEMKRSWGGMVVDPTDSKRLYFGTNKRDHLLISEDGGKTFAPMPNSPGSFTKMTIRKNGNIFGLRGGWSCAFYKYHKAINKWMQLYSKGVSGYAVHPTNENILFVAAGTHTYQCGGATHGRLLKSTDGGANWQVIKDAKGKDFSPWSVYIDPTNPDLMLMSTRYHWEDNGKSSGIMRSLDGGKTWHSIHHNNGPTNFVEGFVYGGVKGRAYVWHGFGGGMNRIDGLHVAKFQGKIPVGMGAGPSTRLAPVRSALNVSGEAPGRIGYSVEADGITDQLVKLGLYDVQGRLVRMLVNQKQAAGSYNVKWNGADVRGRVVSSGIRFFRLEAKGVSQTVKTVVR